MGNFTRKEHIARALLLGRVYDWRDGSYSFLSELGHPVAKDAIFCDTLESMSPGQSNGRLKRTTVSRMPLPWEAPDEEE